MNDERRTDDRTAQILAKALRDVFGENVSTQRFIDISRIPLICQSITGIHTDIKEIKDMIKTGNEDHVSQDKFDPVKNVVYGLVGVILLGVVGALITLVIKK